MQKRILLVVLLFVAAMSQVSAQTIRVAAAANLEAVFTARIIPQFERETGIKVTPVFGATKGLSQQLENGAPFDVFVSADTSTVKKLAAEGDLDKSSVEPYAIGQLVMWTRSDAKVHPQTIADLADSNIVHIAVANPATAPYGAATIDTLTKAKLLTAFQPKIVYAENIQQALQYAVTGNADVSFTALSLVIGRTDGQYVVVPDFLHAPIEQSLGVAPHASAAGRRFADFLTSRDADSIWTSSGYRLPVH